MRPIRAFQLAALVAISGCSQLPVNGPAGSDITYGASATLSTPQQTQVYNYAFVDINPVVLDCLVDIAVESFAKTFDRLGGSGRPPVIRVGVGDVVQVAVFESAQGGLFQNPAPANGGGSFVSFPNQTVSSAGTISVPYVGAVRVIDRTVPEIEHDIQKKLEKDAIEPQVVVTVVEQNRSTVNVFGDAVGGGVIKLSGGGERILDIIAKAAGHGGIKFAGYDIFVTLQRKKRSATVHFPELISHPDENIYVQPGDYIYIFRDQRRYVAAGAIGATGGGASLAANNTLVGAVGQFSFDQERLSLNEAIAKAGGLLDSRADPSQVFLFRLEHRETLVKMGVDLVNFPPNQDVVPTVYRANFRDPSSFLYTQRFPMRNKDTVYVGNSHATELTKFMAYLQSITSTGSGIAVDLNTIAYHGP